MVESIIMPVPCSCSTFQLLATIFMKDAGLRGKTMSYKGAIFDLDGTLVNTLEDIADAANATLIKHCFDPHPIDSYRYFVGDGLKILIERIIPHSDRTMENIVKLMKSFKEFYNVGWDRKSQPYDGIKSMVRTLNNRGVKLAVFSNKPHHFTRLNIKKFFPQNEFVCVQGQVDHLPGKPDPAGAYLIAKRIGLRSEQIVFIGDTSIDILTGIRAGMRSIGVNWGFRDSEELENSGAALIAGDPKDIINFILDSE